ncbi:MAG TPA: signal peptide peptidase SppA [Tepidisphaeraceae bacterium]|jgi:protease-4|nr:signal peptide peptidase SppA [Tepidisphaeraceae bacterium]
MRNILSIAVLFLVGCSAPSFLVTPVPTSTEIQEVQVKEGAAAFPDKIALIEVEGMLANARTGGLLQAQENKLSLFTQQMEQAEKDPKVKAVVLRVNSPGGTVTCSDTMYQMIQRFRARTHKPVIASAQEVMASGAYYVSTACDDIVAQPTSVVGSIGVIFELFEFDQGLAKLGISSNPIKSAAHKDIASPFRPMAADEREILQATVDEYYHRFIGVVQAKYNITDPDKLKIATDGRVFSGEEAFKMGLVDRVGLLDDAIDLAKQMAKAPSAEVVMYKRPYGYSGSIYAETPVPAPQANVLQLPLPDAAYLPRGFYYLWMP